MMMLEHGDMGCGCAQMFHMPGRGFSKIGQADQWGSRGYESTEEYKERFLNSTLKHRRPFQRHRNDTMMSDDFSFNGVMKDGTPIVHLRTARDWLFEYYKRPMTMIVLGSSQHSNGLGEVLESVGFKLLTSHPNPIMGFSKVYVYAFDAISKDEYAKKQIAWQKKLEAEAKAYQAAGIAATAGNVVQSTYQHNDF